MARIAGVDLPRNKRMEVALTYVYGIGRATAMKILGKAGIDPNKPPKTWPEVVAAMAKLKASGHACPFTTGWQVWTQLESFSTWHNVELATKANGLKGMDARMVANSPLHVRHIENLGNMAKQGLFVYKGRGNVPEASFVSGECAMIGAEHGIFYMEPVL